MKLNIFFLVFALFLIAFTIRITGSKEAFFFDEVAMVDSVLEGDSLGVNTLAHRRPPLGVWNLHLTTSIFGLSIFGARMFPIIFGMLTIFMIYKIASSMYNKKVAFFSILVATFSFYHILNSLTIQDGALNLFLDCGVWYFYWLYEKYKKKKYMIVSGLFLGGILLTDYRGAIFFVILTVYKLIKGRSLKKTFFNLFPLFLIAILIYSVFPLIYLFKDPSTYYVTITHVISKVGYKYSIPFLAKIFILIIWATPFLLSFFIFNLFQFEKRDLIFYIWAIIGVGFNMFVLPFGDFSRYFMISITPLCILGGRVLSKIKFNKKWIVGIISLVIFYSLFFFLNLKSNIMYPHFIGYYVEAIKVLKFNFIMPYAIASGSWFGVSFMAIILMVFASLIFFILSLIWFFNKKKRWEYFFIIFICISFAYNLFLAGELLLHLSQPDYSKVIYEMVSFVRENNINENIYATDKGIIEMAYNFKVPRKYGDFRIMWGYVINEVNFDKNIDRLKKKGGFILYLNFNAKFDKKKIDEVGNCKIVKKFSDKGIESGYIYRCEKS